MPAADQSPAQHAHSLEMDFAAPTGQGDQYLTFILAEEEYGIDILQVKEIRGWSRPTPMPKAPEYLKGVINLRGAIIPIIDLRRRFGLDEKSHGPTTVVIVVRFRNAANGSREIGLVVDAVSEVYNVSDKDRQPAPEVGTAIEDSFIEGLATVEEKMVILLDIDRLLTAGMLKSIGQKQFSQEDLAEEEEVAQ